ncbi:hypothetical protein [Paenibacillus oleatilyticus]|uniref:hypothetical protein n=1 Tax=Paenibacillus oleatilyticus TaxID=2594886 RepID=UPI001C1F74C0|nr:hypothetical protein [Paenibacillus oleatilyticus]MBU7316364.1 hypothetical protein [Paenibacillus oleatilyticus]
MPNVVNQLKAVDAAGEDYDDFVGILEDLETGCFKKMKIMGIRLKLQKTLEVP